MKSVFGLQEYVNGMVVVIEPIFVGLCSVAESMYTNSVKLLLKAFPTSIKVEAIEFLT